MPIADSSAPMVVGARHTNNATNEVIPRGFPAPCCAAVNAPNRYKDSDTARNTNVSAMSSSSRACSLGVFLRAADSTMAIILSRKL